jgi:uncharacterized membrane protein
MTPCATEATPSLDVPYVTVAEAGLTFTVSFWVWPTVIVAVAGVTVSFGVLTVTLQVSFLETALLFFLPVTVTGVIRGNNGGNAVFMRVVGDKFW